MNHTIGSLDVRLHHSGIVDHDFSTQADGQIGSLYCRHTAVEQHVGGDLSGHNVIS